MKITRSNILKLMFTVALALVATAAGAQTTRSVAERLARADGAGGARVQVTEYGDAAGLIKGLESTRSLTRLSGYRVRIFFDNSQNARAMASHTMSKFKEMYPDIPIYETYQTPYFKVTVGNCLTNEEAVILWGQIKETFDKAFVIVEDIPVSALAD